MLKAVFNIAAVVCMVIVAAATVQVLADRKAAEQAQ